MATTRRGTNEGSVIREHVRGGFYSHVSLGYNPHTGKRARTTVYGKTKDEVKAKRDAMLVAHRQGTITAPEKHTLGAWLDQWLESKKPHIAEGSYRDYVRILARHVPQDLKKMRLQAIKRAHLKELDTNLAKIYRADHVKKVSSKNKKVAKEAKPKVTLSSRTRSKVFQYLKAAFEEAIEQDLIAVNPARGIRVRANTQELQARATGVEKALTEEVMFQFLDAAIEDPFYPLFYSLFSFGLRRGEGLGMHWKGINFKTGAVKITQQVKLKEIDGKLRPVIGSLKTQSSKGTLYASPDLLEVLKARKAVQDKHRAELGSAWVENDLVFTTSLGTPINPDNVNRTISRICARAGIRPFGSHTARHTMVTTRLKAGEPLEVVSAIARHARPSITADQYRTVFEDEKRVSVYSIAQRRSNRVIASA